MKILMNVDVAKAVRAGGNEAGWKAVEVDVPALTTRQRETLLLALASGPDKGCDAVARTSIAYPVYNRGAIDITLPAPTHDAVAAMLDAVAAWYDGVAATVAAEKRAEAERDAARDAAGATCPVGDLVVLDSHPTQWKTLFWCGSPDSHPVHAGRLAEAEAECLRRNAEMAAEAEAEAEAEAKAEAVLKEWVAEHGSTTTKLRLEEGYKTWVASARGEYAAAHAAEMVAASGLPEAVDPPGTDGSPRAELRLSPTGEEITALRVVRRAVGHSGAEARLMLVRYDRDVKASAELCDDDDDDDVPAKQYRTEIRLSRDTPAGIPVEAFVVVVPE